MNIEFIIFCDFICLVYIIPTHQYLDEILKRLTPEYVRCLMIGEDELARSASLERIFPTATTFKYNTFFENPRDTTIVCWTPGRIDMEPKDDVMSALAQAEREKASCGINWCTEIKKNDRP